MKETVGRAQDLERSDLLLRGKSVERDGWRWLSRRKRSE
jgi:hypothetical protein